MAIGERRSFLLGRERGQKKEWSVLDLDAEALKSITCLMLLFSCKSDQRAVTRRKGIMWVLWVSCSRLYPYCSVEYLFIRGRFKTVGVAVCAANSSKGANTRPVMSGVTRQRFQNTAVNKVKVSHFAGRRFVFMSWTVHGWSNFSKQTSNLYGWGFLFLFLFLTFWI